ncbi:MAG: MFS transporter, partial [Thermoleophilia bacterium]|nr:MFS transporter [Thermoleophilia bacterium]
MTAERAHSSGRRVQLAAAVVAMVCIAPLQYSWTLFTTPLEQQNPWSLPHVQLAFTFFIVAQTLSQPLGGYFMDRRGPRLAFIVAAALIVVGWGGLGVTGSRPLFYGLYSLAGVGAGIVYAGAIGTGIRWFPNRRGLALGLIAAGFGIGAAPFTPFAHRLLEGYGVRPAFVVTGLVIGAAVLAVGLLLKTPPVRPRAVAPAADPDGTAHPSAHGGLARPDGPVVAAPPAAHEG